MRKKYVCLAVALGATLSGCATVAAEPGPATYYDKAYFAETQEPESLSSSDSAILSDEDIKRILTYHYSPQKQNKIGILALGQSYWYGWSDELSRAGVEVQSKLVSKLLSSPFVFDASYLPSLLIPEKKTVGHFREAGARYQADLLLIYCASCRTYEKSRFLSPDKSKSYCKVEAVLLDIRTGILPFTVTASRDFVAEKRSEDLNLRETIRRAELKAVADALSEVGDEVVRFLGTVGR